MTKYREELLESHRLPNWDDSHGCFAVAKIVKEFNVKVMAEIGVCLGHTAAEVLALDQVEKYFMVDNWVNENDYFKIRNNFHDKCVEIFREDSMSVVDRFEDECLDLVYINESYTYKMALEDLRGWYRKVKAGGILVGRGYSQNCGVKQAVSRMFPEESINIKDSIYWVFKE